VDGGDRREALSWLWRSEIYFRFTRVIRLLKRRLLALNGGVFRW